MRRCILCNSDEDDDVLYGELLQKDEVFVHLNCLYLTTCLVQEVDEDSLEPHLYGFTLTTIRREANKVRNNCCCFCKEYNANIVCCEFKCRRAFHMICGVKNNALFEFCETYRSFCDRHGRKLRKKPDSNETCCICYDRLKTKFESINRSNVMRSPCCRNGWFHKYCLQKYAKTAGYFFKCPLCNDEKLFREQISKLGIFILDRDADWELESNAFHELMERPYICTAENCQNELGREDTTNTPFIFCYCCGHKAIHEACLTMETELYTCKECVDIFANNVNTTNSVVASNEEDIYVDVEAFTDEDKSFTEKFIDEISAQEESKEAEKSILDSEDENTIFNSKHLRLKKSKLLTDSSEASSPTIVMVDSEDGTRNKHLRRRNARLLPDSPESSTPPKVIEDSEDGTRNKHLRRRNARLLPDSPESSTPPRVIEDSDDGTPIMHLRRKNARLLPDSPESTTPSTVMRESEDELPIMHLRRKNARLLPDSPESSTPSTVMRESEDELPIVNKCHLRRKRINIITDSPDLDSGKENSEPYLDKITNNNLKDSDDDTIARKKSLSNSIARRTRNGTAKIESECSEKDDTDQSAFKMQKPYNSLSNLFNTGCIARRTRRSESSVAKVKTKGSENDTDESEFNVIKRKISGSKIRVLRKSKVEATECSTNDTDESEFNVPTARISIAKLLETSCIAKRTRRRVSNVEELNNSTGSDDSDEDVKSRANRKRSACKELNNACLAKRTRQSQNERKRVVRRSKLRINDNSSESEFS